jgi:crotonobetainyl-CoA:carnitine CoA-transferase CaiB-like acyl-CoA transferase
MNPARALEGVRVLDLTRYIPGPYCTMLLGDLGADVVKIEEPPFGDATRAVPPAAGDDSAVHAALNRNKRSAVVDIRTPEGALAVRRLAAKADVLVEGFRPGALERRGLGYAELRRSHPRLVYCSLTGFGQDGLLADRAGHDIGYLALSGLLGANRDASGQPVIPGAQIADMSGGLVALVGILAALAARAHTGVGQQVDVSLLSSALALTAVPAARLLAGGGPMSELTGSHACYNVYRCRDGRYLAVGALESKFWEALCRALGHEDRVGRQWQAPAKARETITLFARTFATRDRDEWVSELAEHDVCVEPVLDMDEALGREPATADLVERVSGDSSFASLGLPFRMSGTPPSYARPAPALGQHTDEVLGEAGFSAADIARLREDGVVA